MTKTKKQRAAKTPEQRADMKQAVGLALWLREWAAYIEIAPPEFFRVLDAADAARQLTETRWAQELLRMIDDAAARAKQEAKSGRANDRAFWDEQARAVLFEIEDRRLSGPYRFGPKTSALLARAIWAASNPGGAPQQRRVSGRSGRVSKAQAFQDLCGALGLGPIKLDSLKRDRRRRRRREPGGHKLSSA